MRSNRFRAHIKSLSDGLFDSVSSSGRRTKQGDWRALDIALATLENTLEVFPPLKSALNGLREVIRHTEISKQSLHEYKQLASELQSHIDSLRACVDQAKPTWMAHSIAKIARALEEENECIKTQQGRSGMGGTWNALRDEDAILQSYQRIESLFRQLQTDISLSTWSSVREQHMTSTLDKLLPVPGAWYDAALSAEAHRSGCTPGTRELIIQDFLDWASDADTYKLYWMNGMAGTGKTTIAYTLCHRLESTKQLGACFFCSRISPDCRDVNRVLPTITYQLSEFSNPYRNKIFEVLSATHNIAQRNIHVQFNELILKPLVSVKDALPADVVVVVDALDECSGGEQIISLLLKSASQLPIKFIVTSRPEPNLTRKMDAFWSSSIHQAVHLHEIEKSLVQADISIYLQRVLDESGVLPTSEEIKRLAAYAGSLFIVAATAVRYIVGHGSGISAHRSRQRMQAILAMTEAGSADTSKYKSIDSLYRGILEQVLEKGHLDKDEVEEVYQVLWTTVCMREPVSIKTLSKMLAMESNIVLDGVGQLQSVLHHSKATGMVSTFHASFPDFMFSKDRASRFYCDQVTHDHNLARSCFDLMQKELRFNICGIKTLHYLDKDIPDLKGRLEDCVSSELFYACRYWADHLHTTSVSDETTSLLGGFLYEHLLLWIEVINLKGWISSAADAMLQALKWLTDSAPANVSSSPDLAKLERATRDAQAFVTSFAASPVSHSTPHLYLSSLPTSSKHSELFGHHRNRFRGLPGELTNTRQKAKSGIGALAVWTPGYNVTSLAISPDGARLASGTHGGTIRIWDAKLGVVILDLIGGHSISTSIETIAFSSSGASLASGAYDGGICIWNVATAGVLNQTIKHHTDSINAIAFHPNSRILASASDDGSVCLWDLHDRQQPSLRFQFDDNSHWDVSFSPDGLQLASAGYGQSIHIRSTETGELMADPLRGHEPIKRVRYTPDGLRIVSYSQDKTVRVWSSHDGTLLAGPFHLDMDTNSPNAISLSPDPQGSLLACAMSDATIQVISTNTGQLVSGPFSGHTSTINSVHFLPTGNLVSASADGTVRIWEVNRGATQPAIAHQGHTMAIMSVTVSPDGTQVVSSSDDRSICVWDATSGVLLRQIPQAHDDYISSVSFCSDGIRFASGSDDRNIRIWSAHGDEPTGDTLTGHKDSVQAVRFSSNRNQLVSGSGDRTIRIWDLRSDEVSSRCLLGHTDWVRSVAFSPDDTWVVSGSDDCKVGLWDARDSVLIWMGSTHTNEVNSVMFSPDGAFIASGSQDGIILFWNASTGAVIGEPLVGQSLQVQSLTFSPDGNTLASGSTHHMISVWDVNTRALKHSFEAYSGVYSVAFSPDGRHVISGEKDGSIRKWDTSVSSGSTDGEAASWVARKDGWVTDQKSRLLVWLPHDLRGRMFLDPRNVLTIIDGQTIAPEMPNLDDYHFGDTWKECYTGATP